MSYVDKHLLADERVLRRGEINFTAYIGPVILFLLGIVTAALLIGLVLIACSIILIIRLATTEVAVTDRRVIGKVGLIAINSLDLRLAKLEGVSVRRGFLGAMFDYGAVTVVGSGSTRMTFPGMSNPEGLRRAFVDAAEKSNAVVSTHAPSESSQYANLPLFEVQIIDSSSGYETWIEVKARDKEEALRRAADTGMIAGACRLKSIG